MRSVERLAMSMRPADDVDALRESPAATHPYWSVPIKTVRAKIDRRDYFVTRCNTQPRFYVPEVVNAFSRRSMLTAAGIARQSGSIG
jgi:hypothetical protein